ncbi:MAG: hypothetical protein RLY70_4501 [Planctomycetota bacterium]|jgi:hypothetical protein
MRKFTLGAWLVIAQIPVAMFGAEIELRGIASNGGTTILRSSATGASRVVVEGNSRNGAVTDLRAEADGHANLTMLAEASGRNARADSKAKVSGQRGGSVDARSVNQAIGGESRNSLLASASDGGFAAIDQVTSSRFGYAENSVAAEAVGGVVDQVSTVIANRGKGISAVHGASHGQSATTRQESLVDSLGGFAKASMKSKTMAGKAFAKSQSLGVVRGGHGGSVHSESTQQTEGASSKSVVENSFFQQ